MSPRVAFSFSLSSLKSSLEYHSEFAFLVNFEASSKAKHDEAINTNAEINANLLTMRPPVFFTKIG